MYTNNRSLQRITCNYLPYQWNYQKKIVPSHRIAFLRCQIIFSRGITPVLSAILNLKKKNFAPTTVFEAYVIYVPTWPQIKNLYVNFYTKHGQKVHVKFLFWFNWLFLVCVSCSFAVLLLVWVIRVISISYVFGQSRASIVLKYPT